LLEPEIITTQNWVNVTEAAEITGYHRTYVQKLARDNWNKPEAEREFRVHRHSGGYMIWLPDILKYAEEPNQGPRPKHNPKN
jgi:hypothetical protein